MVEPICAAHPAPTKSIESNQRVSSMNVKKTSNRAGKSVSKPADTEISYPPDFLLIESDPKDVRKNLARAVLRPAVTSAMVAREYHQYKFSELDLMSLVGELEAQAKTVISGDMGRPEAILSSQAHALDAIFAELSRRAIDNIRRGNADVGDRFLRLGLKAQGQCRATLETLGNLKNPPVVYARQANFANGPQQVNNATPPTHAGNCENEQIKLSGANHELCANTRTQTATIGVDKKMAAMAEIHRAKVNRRKD